jgi:coenzyme F420-reducing hydrogenase alpha subunit
MNARNSIEGALTVGIVVIDSTVADVRLRSSRTTGIGAMLAGRPVSEALSLVPMLFSLCGMAQGIAAVGACESATGITASPAQRAARDLLILAELVDSHAWQIAMEWPRLTGGDPNPALLRPVRNATAALVAALYPARDWNRPGGGALSPDATRLRDACSGISTAIDRLTGSGFNALGDADDLKHWSQDSMTPAAPLFAQIIADDMAGFGRSGVVALPDLPADWFAQRLAATLDFSGQPHLDGKPADTGALQRVAATPLIADLKRHHGNGILARFTAKLVELASLPARFSALAAGITAESAGATPLHATGTGAGIADTARGRLAHWVDLEQGLVKDYRTVAPNEWNFHPQGALVRGLVGLPACDDLRRRAGLLIAALDPCVPCNVMIEEYAGA